MFFPPNWPLWLHIMFVGFLLLNRAVRSFSWLCRVPSYKYATALLLLLFTPLLKGPWVVPVFRSVAAVGQPAERVSTYVPPSTGQSFSTGQTWRQSR